MAERNRAADGRWEGPGGEIGQEVETVSSQTLAAYREAPKYVEEHHNLELAAVEGGYGRRQLFELIQNGADELVGDTGRVQVVLTDDALYCANQGRPLSVEGVRALLFSHLSAKKGTEIGRFGLGFKSVLGITTAPEIFSRSGSVRFDPAHTARQIKSALGEVPQKLPTLRVGQAVDPETERREDDVLAELMTWATTVVRLRRDAGDSDWLSQDIAYFPAQFLLFSSHVKELVLEDRVEEITRTISARRDGPELVLEEGGTESRWRVFQTLHEPTDEARQDAGRHADRDEIPLVWAVPTRRRRRGEFWAFFPTLDQTTLSGVVNAPWKLNEDRTRIIEGPFNRELLQAVATIVLDNVDRLVVPDDPGLVLDLMPARGREAAGWADEVLTATVNDAAGYSPSIPDQTGELELPGRLSLHPEGVPRRALDAWAAAPTRPQEWCHPSVETRERRPRVEIYMQPSGVRAAGVGEWLEALIPSDDREAVTDGFAAAIEIAAGLMHEDRERFGDEVRAARILLDEKGDRRSLDEGPIFLRAPLPLEVKVTYVSDALADREDVRAALDDLGVREVDPLQVLRVLLAKKVDTWAADDWNVFWSLVGRADQAQVYELLKERGITGARLSVHCADGRYRKLATTLLPGEIVPEQGPDDRGVLIDTGFHSDVLSLLRLLGAVAAPTPTGGSSTEPWYTEFESEALDKYTDELSGTGSNPSREYLGFREEPFAGPLTPLRVLSGDACARYTGALLSVTRDLAAWTFHHSTQTRYPEMSFAHPVVWMIERYGRLPTSLGPRAVADAVGPGLEDYRRLLPVASVPPEAAESLGLPGLLSELGEEQWEGLLGRIGELERDKAIGAAYAMAAEHGLADPGELRCRVGRALETRPTEGVAVTADDAMARVFVETSQPFIRVDEAERAALMVERWGLRSAEETVRAEVGWTPNGEPEPLIDAFPMLSLSLDAEQRDLQLVPCDELYVVTSTDSGTISSDKELVVQDGRVFRRTRMEDRDFLHDLSSELDLGLDTAQIELIVKNLDRKRIQGLKKKLRGAEDDEARLLLAIDPDLLRRGLSKALLEAVEDMHGQLSDRDIAQLALVSHGVNVLREYQEELDEKGLVTPRRWSGSRRALEFVRELGFGPEYAGFPPNRPTAKLLVEGRPDLGPLHDYQETIVDDIHELLASSDGRRGLMSLPTGAGKTRVTIEALVRAIVRGELDSPVLWVAQTGELCEQAVETWSEIWRGFGPTEPLTISRLWESYEADEAEAGHQVVVATIAKLDAGVYEKSDYDWLSKAVCLVVDEAHSSIGPAYTRLLEWQGMARGKERAPLIGLTATPFRGTSKEETERLVSRYGRRRLDLAALGGEDAYPHLQSMGILSEVDHDLLPGSDLELSDQELEELKRTRRLPPGAGRRLAADVGRNQTLLESVMETVDEGPVLLFAASVEHAETMAALLVREGVSAAAISGETDRSARRHYIERFRAGDVRVLTNFNVLTAGFDAPKVRSVYVARPTYSPNLYQQMIGRGLRGPLNNGTERCLLVNVADNVLQYGEKLAFHEFDYLWRG